MDRQRATDAWRLRPLRALLLFCLGLGFRSLGFRVWGLGWCSFVLGFCCLGAGCATCFLRVCLVCFSVWGAT